MIITGKTYDTLKWVAQIFLPALGTLYVGLAALWDLPKPQEVAGTILAVDTFLGVLLGISASNMNKQTATGVIQTTQGADGKVVHSLELDNDPQSLPSKRRAVFDVVGNEAGLSTVELIGLLCLAGIAIILIVIL